ncbi:hypothetical protein ACTQ6A_14235 [Lachnospiraceae bacterium LCP25S3_G4]
MSCIDWEYYNSHFKKVEKSIFDQLIGEAEAIVSINTNGRSDEATGYKLARVKNCVCNVLNELASQEKNGAGNGVNSVSNKGYSENYALVTREQAEEQLRKVCIKWLSGTGLMGVL